MESMCKSLTEALGKYRHVRSIKTMADSRGWIRRSFDVVKDWRSIRMNVQVKQLFGLISNNTALLNEKLFLQLRNFLIVEIILPNAQRSGVITRLLVKEVSDAKLNGNSEDNHRVYIQNHKTGYKQPAIIYLDHEIYNYLLLFVSVVIGLLPPLGHQRHGPICNAIQTWRSDSLVYTNISSCFRAGLKLFGIDDPDARPTHFRKAASTLISIHCLNLQEPLNQFMCHDRSTAERQYRHQMSHQYLSHVFTEIARCQSHPYEN